MKARPKRAMLAIMVSPDDLDVLRAIFGQTPDESESAKLAKRMMKAVHRARKKLGFRWEY